MSSVLRFDEWQDSNGVPVLDGTGLSIPTSALPVGTILQVVSTTKTDTFTSASTTFTDITGLTASITPSSTSSKILVFARLSFASDALTSSARSQLLRDSTPIFVGTSVGSRIPALANIDLSLASDLRDAIVNHLDSPATTSTLTYKMQIRTGAGTVFVNRTENDTDNSNFGRTASSITLMEVAG